MIVGSVSGRVLEVDLSPQQIDSVHDVLWIFKTRYQFGGEVKDMKLAVYVTASQNRFVQSAIKNKYIVEVSFTNITAAWNDLRAKYPDVALVVIADRVL